MENKKNLILAVTLSAGILIAWQLLMVPASPPAELASKPPVSVEDNRATIGDPTASTRPKSQGGATEGPGEAEGDGVHPPGQADTSEGDQAAQEPERELVLENEQVRYVFSNRGGTLWASYLKGEKFQKKSGSGGAGHEPLEIVRAGESELVRPLRISFPRSQLALTPTARWQTVESSPTHFVVRAEGTGVRVTRTVRLGDEPYRLAMEILIENTGAADQKHNLVLHLFGRQNPDSKGGGFFDYATASIEEMVCHVNGSLERRTIEALHKEAFDAQGSVRYLAADERFFTVAVVPAAQAAGEVRKCGLRAIAEDERTGTADTGSSEGVGEAILAFSERTLLPGGVARYPFEIFVGPKYRDALARVPIPDGAADAELDGLVNVTFAFLSRPMLALLKFFHTTTGNWGLAIILLTVLVRLITFFPTHKQLVAGKKMARLAPKLAELKKKYGNDRERMGRETMNLYKAHGVNPLGGCLPALIQMPIWIALFSTLSYAVELYRSAFVLHIQDLSAPDPFYLAPLVMGVVMYLQMRMAPPGADPAQQKMMAVMMPVMFTGFSLFLPAGLAIYTLTSYLIGILHQLWVNRLDRKHSGPVPVVATVSQTRGTK